MDDASPIVRGDAAAPPLLDLTLMGHMAARNGDGLDVLPRVRKTRAVLAVVALAAPRPVLRDHLASLLWSRRDREQARGSLRQCVHELQEMLAPLGADLLIADRRHISLRAQHMRIDVYAADAASSQDVFLDDLTGLDPAFDKWLEEQRLRLAKRAVAVAEAALQTLVTGIGTAQAIIAMAERLLAFDRTHEAAWRALMTAHIASGERAMAIAAYERCCVALAERAGLMPSAETRAVLAGIREADFPPQRGHAAVPPGAAERHALTRYRRRGPKHGARLGVMPFRSLNGDTDDPLSFGLAEEITIALARFRWFFLIASPSLATVGSELPGYGDRWNTLDLDFLLDGTVQRGLDRVRISVRLLDVNAGGEIIWSGRFDRNGEDVLTLQDEIAAEAVARIDPELLLREGRRAAACPPSSATAYDLVLRAIPAIYRLVQSDFEVAGETLAEAVALAPDYAAAHAWFACWHIFLVGQNWARNPAAAMARAGDLADRAVMLDPSDARALTLAGHVRSFLYGRVDEAIDLHERALALNPNLPLAWAFSGLAHAYAGMHEDALVRIEHARRLSPYDPHAFFFDMAMMLPLLMQGMFDAVIQLGKHSLALNPSCTSTYKIMLSACGHLDRAHDIETLSRRLLQMEPEFKVSTAVARSCLQRTADRELYAQGLRRAGLPE